MKMENRLSWKGYFFHWHTSYQFSSPSVRNRKLYLVRRRVGKPPVLGAIKAGDVQQLCRGVMAGATVLLWDSTHTVCLKAESHITTVFLGRKRSVIFRFFKCYFSELQWTSHPKERGQCGRTDERKGGKYCMSQKIATLCSGK